MGAVELRFMEEPLKWAGPRDARRKSDGTGVAYGGGSVGRRSEAANALHRACANCAHVCVDGSDYSEVSRFLQFRRNLASGLE
jgi:hypothetical protein